MTILQEKALEMVCDTNLTQEQVRKQIEEEFTNLQNKISVRSFSSSVNLAECDRDAAEKIIKTLQIFRRLKGWVYCSEEITNPDFLIETIKVIGNDVLSERFLHQKEEFNINNKSTKETLLFHGTCESNLKNIIKQNFDLNAVPNISPGEAHRKKKSVYGEGIYLSQHPGYCTHYGNCLILCRVVLGDLQVMDQADSGSKSNIPHMFDSRKVNTASIEGLIYVVKKSCQILPCTIVTFKDKNISGKITGRYWIRPSHVHPVKQQVNVKLSPQEEQILKAHPGDIFLKDILLSSNLNELEKKNIIRGHLKI